MNDLERHMLSKQFDKLTRQLTNAVQLLAQKSWKYKDRQYSAVERRFPAANDEIEGRHQRSNNFRAGIETGARLVVLPLSGSSLGVGAGPRTGGVRIFDDDTRIDLVP